MTHSSQKWIGAIVSIRENEPELFHLIAHFTATILYISWPFVLKLVLSEYSISSGVMKQQLIGFITATATTSAVALVHLLQSNNNKSNS